MEFDYINRVFHQIASKHTQLALNVNNIELAKRQGINEKVVRRLLDLDHVSRIVRLETALENFDIQTHFLVSAG